MVASCITGPATILVLVIVLLAPTLLVADDDDYNEAQRAAMKLCEEKDNSETCFARAISQNRDVASGGDAPKADASKSSEAKSGGNASKPSGTKTTGDATKAGSSRLKAATGSFVAAIAIYMN